MFFVMSSTSAVMPTDCPNACLCKNGSDNETLRVQCQNVAEFPTGLPKSTLSLSVVRSQALKRLTLNNLSTRQLGTSSLRRLVLSDNALEIIDRDSFAAQSTLIFLYLNNNTLTGFEPGTFKRNTRLEVLNISHNRLNALRLLNALSVPELRLLDISHCELETLDGKMFVEVPTLREIRLGYNQLQIIEEELFSPLDILEYLYLSHNRIKLIVDKAFTNLRHLKLLDLSYNVLTELNPRLLFYLSHLEYLYLNNNRFKIFEPDWIKTITLKRLDLNSNYLPSFNYMQGLANVTDLNLADNQISAIDVDVVCQLKKLKYFNVTLNPLRCGCALRATWEALSNQVLFIAQCQINASIAFLRLDHALPPLDCGSFYQCPLTKNIPPKSNVSNQESHWSTVIFYLYMVVAPILGFMIMCAIIIYVIIFIRKRRPQRAPFERTNAIVYTPNSVFQEAYDPMQKVYAEISEMQPFREPPHSLYTFNPSSGVYSANAVQRLSNSFEMQQQAELGQHHSYQSLGPGTSGSLYRRSGLEPGAAETSRRNTPPRHRVYQPARHGPSTSTSGRDVESDDSWVEHL